ncbi:hypothetical protein AQUSIP_15670 [Aquicella siphonis]|uniref:Transposase DDE domain-containing protein n=1 Tax=Aquicella siphonis TaxID=254247 RepID=A0A5E4PII3_9COXI|nr:hypothetical protein [Aquicella siphonis]VVC76258.1 hypothetical protein AQUSIP_15670 [Aquicella siphonis]
MAKKIAYRVRNWKDYNFSLINRGNLTIWFSEDAIKSWYQKPQKTKGMRLFILMNRRRARPFLCP